VSFPKLGSFDGGVLASSVLDKDDAEPSVLAATLASRLWTSRNLPIGRHSCNLATLHLNRAGFGMVASLSEFQTKILRKSLVPGEYKLYRAALEWDLTDPIVIEAREDLKSEKRWQGHLEPYHHQVTNLITFCRRLPVTLLADDVGAGWSQAN
jgi:hypothetical protein